MGASTTLSPVIADDGSIRTTDKRLLPNQLELRGGVRPMIFLSVQSPHQVMGNDHPYEKRLTATTTFKPNFLEF